MPRGLQLLTPPAAEPVTLAEAKLWCKVDVPDDDDLIAGNITAARDWIEQIDNRTLVSQTRLLTLDRFPRYSSSAVWQYNSDAIWQQRLPVTQLSGQWYPDRASIRVTRPPLQQLLYITYTDGQGILQCLVNSIAAGVTAPGSQAVTPAIMTGIVVGTQLVVDVGAAQETVVVTAVTTTTFTATFAQVHPVNVVLYAVPSVVGSGNVLAGGALVNVDTTTDPGRIAPGYGQIWPIVRQQTATVQVGYVAGYGPQTSVALAIAQGQQTVTPASMYGIYPGTILAVDYGQNRELVQVTAVTATTFTATFKAAHLAGTAIGPGMPEGLRSLLKLLVCHWYDHRSAVGAFGREVPMAAQSLLWANWPGEYE